MQIGRARVHANAFRAPQQFQFQQRNALLLLSQCAVRNGTVLNHVEFVVVTLLTTTAQQQCCVQLDGVITVWPIRLIALAICAGKLNGYVLDTRI